MEGYRCWCPGFGQSFGLDRLKPGHQHRSVKLPSAPAPGGRAASALRRQLPRNDAEFALPDVEPGTRPRGTGILRNGSQLFRRRTSDSSVAEVGYDECPDKTLQRMLLESS